MAAVVGVGCALGRFRLLGDDAARVLARINLTVAIPTRHRRTGLARRPAPPPLARRRGEGRVDGARGRRRGAGAPTGLAPGRRRSHRRHARGVVPNASHLGIPIAVYVVGDAVAAVPTPLFQQLVLAHAAFALLDRVPVAPGVDTVVPAGRPSVVGRTLRNPIIVASLSGPVLAALPWDPPDVVLEPVRVLGVALGVEGPELLAVVPMA